MFLFDWLVDLLFMVNIVVHFNVGAILPDGTDDDGYMEVLERELPPLLGDFAPDLVLYQAGVDPHGQDKLGRLALTDKGLEQFLADWAKMNAPEAVNAG